MTVAGVLATISVIYIAGAVATGVVLYGRLRLESIRSGDRYYDRDPENRVVAVLFWPVVLPLWSLYKLGCIAFEGLERLGTRAAESYVKFTFKPEPEDPPPCPPSRTYREEDVPTSTSTSTSTAKPRSSVSH